MKAAIQSLINVGDVSANHGYVTTLHLIYLAMITFSISCCSNALLMFWFGLGSKPPGEG